MKTIFLLLFITFFCTILFGQNPETAKKLTHSPGSLRVTVWNDTYLGPHHEPSMAGVIAWDGTNGIFGSSILYGTEERHSMHGLIGFGAYFNDVVILNSNFSTGFTEETVENITFDQVSTSMIRDDNATDPYGFDVIQKTYSKSGFNVVFCRNGYINTTKEKIIGLYSSIGADIDIGNSSKNAGGIDTSANLVYGYEPGTSKPYFGYITLDKVSGCKVGTTRYNDVLSLREGIFTSTSNIDQTPPEIGDQLATIGCFVGDINVGDTAWATFAIVAGSNFDGLRANAKKAFEIGRDAGWTEKVVKSVTAVDKENSFPQIFKLSQNYPNPFNPTTIINFSIPKESIITIKVFDVLGKEVATLINERHTAGNFQAELNASDLPTGVYFYNLQAGDFVETKKMILIK